MNILMGDKFGLIFNQQPSTDRDKDKMTIEMWIALLEEELKEIQDAHESGDEKEFRDGLADIRHVLEGLVSYTDLGPLHVVDFYAVYKSNLTKYHGSKDHALETMTAYESGTHPDKLGIKIECYVEEVPKAIGDDSAWLVKKKNGKILKPVNTYCYPELPSRTKVIEFDVYEAKDLVVPINRRRYYFGTDINFAEITKSYGFETKFMMTTDDDGDAIATSKSVPSIFHLVYNYDHAWLVINKSKVLAKFILEHGDIKLESVY
jgi:hypothetical protein